MTHCKIAFLALLEDMYVTYSARCFISFIFHILHVLTACFVEIMFLSKCAEFASKPSYLSNKGS